MSAPKRKLIEVALPLESINAASQHEKSVPRRGHPATMHLWWARRPLATARAVLFAQLVDDPSVRHDEFRQIAIERGDFDPDDSADQMVVAERDRLFEILERLVAWENMNDEGLYAEARAEILRSTGGQPPAILDPFAGGGTIPLEAQRLGLEALASDLNPVAVLINKALIEIPPKFSGLPPVFPGAAAQRNAWPKATGLAEDIRRYGAWMRDEAERRIGHLYPKAKLPGGTQANVVAWIWARTAICPNPACGTAAPLVRSWWLGKKKGKEAYIIPKVLDGRVEYEIGHDPKSAPTAGTIAGGDGVCIACGSAIPNRLIRDEATSTGLGAQLIAVVAEGQRRRVYLPPTHEHIQAAISAARPTDVPEQSITTPNHDVDRLPMYGMPLWSDAFTNRQLTVLATLSDLVAEVRDRIVALSREAGTAIGAPLSEGGADAQAYADAVATYLPFAVSKLADWGSSICSWIPQIEGVRDTFPRQAVAMTWDYVEINPFSSSVGNFGAHVEWVADAVDRVPANGSALAEQADAATRTYPKAVVSTDPPYYDNVGYSVLSDFFYVWLRRSARTIHPDLLGTLLVPKAEELIANPNLHGGVDGAKRFFESGFENVFANARLSASDEYPIAVYYAFKQSESTSVGESSKGWETILGSMVRAGWQVTATWPVRTERAGRVVAVGNAALASSIVLALRPRPADAPPVDRSGLIQELRAKLPDQLRDLQQGGIAAVDLQQAAIGPGIGIFSKYSKVIDPSGQPMSVHDALVQINDILGEVLSGQEGDFDSDSRWCVAWFEEFGFDKGEYGTADTLARAKNTSVDTLARSGAVDRAGSKVWLKDFTALPDKYDPLKDDRISIWEVVLHLAKTLDGVGLDEAARVLAGARERGIDVTAAKELAYLLYALAGKRKLTDFAVALNLLTSSWSDLVAAVNRAAERADVPKGTQVGFDFEALKDED